MRTMDCTHTLARRVLSESVDLEAFDFVRVEWL